MAARLFQTKLLSRLSHKVRRLLSSPVLMCKFTDNVTARRKLGKLERAIFSKRKTL